jgi:hypothetical protein
MTALFELKRLSMAFDLPRECLEMRRSPGAIW